jgi:hypothetical protein
MCCLLAVLLALSSYLPISRVVVELSFLRLQLLLSAHKSQLLCLQEKVSVHGEAVSSGHPVRCSDTRVLFTLLGVSSLSLFFLFVLIMCRSL